MATKAPTMKIVKTPSKTAEAVAEVAAETKAPAKTVLKTAAKAAPKAKPAPVETAEVETAATTATEAPANDLIAKTAHEIENLKQEAAFQQVPKLLDNIDHDYFKLGGVLSVIQSQGWFMDKGHENFRAFVEAECGIQYRKAMYLIQIYNGLLESGVTWDQVKHLGWTKLKELAPILSPDNVLEWVELAEGVTVLQLQEYIKAATKGEDAGNSPETDQAGAKDTTTMTFKLHTDQKTTIREALDKARHETGTEFDAVALEAIALDFLGGESKIKAMPSLLEIMSKKSPEEVLEAFGEAFPTILLSAEVFDTAEEAAAAQAAQAEADEAAEAEAGTEAG